ncbi:hypothetical protein Lal_00043939 [Lupinus albus]|nr:hypothetical protein Lal_00043939 [Lupinus albus]
MVYKFLTYKVTGNIKLEYLIETLPENAQRLLTSCQPRLTWSPSDKPDPEKSRVKTVIFDGRRTTAASLASARHPLQHCTHTHI